jgi:hypothetical protein
MDAHHSFFILLSMILSSEEEIYSQLDTLSLSFFGMILIVLREFFIPKTVSPTLIVQIFSKIIRVLK